MPHHKTHPHPETTEFYVPSDIPPLTFENSYGQQIHVDALDFLDDYSYHETKEEMSDLQQTKNECEINVLVPEVESVKNNIESEPVAEEKTTKKKTSKKKPTIRTGSKSTKRAESKKHEIKEKNIKNKSKKKNKKNENQKNATHKKSKKKRTRRIIDDDDEVEPDDSDLDDTRSVDDESVGSLVDFIVEDEKAIEEEIKQSKRIKVTDPLDGIDPSNIVTGKRQRKQPERYQDPHFWQLMTQDMDDSEIEQFEEEVKKDDEEQPDAAEEDEEFRVSEEVSDEEEDEDEINTPSEEAYDPEEDDSEYSDDD